MDRIVADSHIHSKYSFDSSLKIKYIVERMEQLGTKYVALTDHVEFNTQPVNEVIRRIKMRNNKIDELQDGTDIKLIKGIEVSEPHLYPAGMRALSSIDDIDYILGSIHHICNASIKKFSSMPDAIDLYLDSLLNMVMTADIDAVAHLDYFKKYITQYEPDLKTVEKILKTIIERNIALEVNTSGIRSCYEVYPSFDILDMYKDLGGKKIIYGSDAHKLEELGDDIALAHHELASYEFEEGIVLKREFKKI